MRRTIFSVLAAAAIATLSPVIASAHGPGGGGHGGGGFGGHGFGGHGFHGGGFRGGFGPRFGFGVGIGYPYYYSGYPYYDAYPDDDSCYVVHHRVHTRHGWGYRRVVVCD